ncbi:hypothetical protein [Streptacidiphilus sp. PAMC 29251]
MEVSEKVTQWMFSMLLQSHPRLDLSALLLAGVMLFAFGERRSFGRLVLAFGLVLLFGGHLAIRITMPNGPS